MDPQSTSDGKLYAPKRFSDIIEERYYVSKYTHTSYIDTAQLTPREREQILALIKKDRDKENELIKKHNEELSNKTSKK